MSVIARVVLVFTLAGCGSPVVGTWQVSTTVTETSSQGISSTRTVTDQLRIDSGGWRVGGGCVAALAFDGASASLRRTSRCAPSSADEPLFLLGALGGTWMSGDQLEVTRAQFSVTDSDQLVTTVEYRLGRTLDDPSTGRTVAFGATADKPLVRAK